MQLGESAQSGPGAGYPEVRVVIKEETSVFAQDD